MAYEGTGDSSPEFITNSSILRIIIFMGCFLIPDLRGLQGQQEKTNRISRDEPCYNFEEKCMHKNILLFHLAGNEDF